jgi:hypothetical protein
MAAEPGLSGVMANDGETSAASINPMKKGATTTTRTTPINDFVNITLRIAVCDSQLHQLKIT